MEYFIRGPQGDRDSVELWSTERLPFEPSGRAREMRDALRRTLREMPGHPDRALHAVYFSREEGFVDAENVLIYNVGSGAFSHLCQSGLCFEWCLRAPPDPPSTFSGSPKHYHLYHVVELDNLRHKWGATRTLASWRDVVCPVVRSDLKPAEVWQGMKQGGISPARGTTTPPQYGVEIILQSPQTVAVNLAGVVKPLMDGVLSAFHLHDGSNMAEVTRRVSKALGTSGQAVAKMLGDEAGAVLGETCLVRIRSSGVQWCPADDGCVLGEIDLKTVTAGGPWSLSGRVFEVIPIEHPRYSELAALSEEENGQWQRIQRPIRKIESTW